MRSLLIAALAASTILVAGACGDDAKTTPDGPKSPDMAIADAGADGPIDGAPDAPPDVPPDAFVPDMFEDGIAAAKAATAGTGLTLPIRGAIVTYLKPQIGSTQNDPAGFTIQRLQNGPAMFVAVDPATTTPPLAVGDTVDFTVTELKDMMTGMQKRIVGISDLVRTAQGADVNALSVDITAMTALPIDEYDSRLVDFVGTAGTAPASSGSAFQRVRLDTTGITGDDNFQARFPQTIVDMLDVSQGCTITANNVPVGRFNVQTQIGVYRATDFTLSNCPAPTVVSAAATSATTVQITFTRNIKMMSVLAAGTQFTFDNGLVASAATAGGRVVTVTTMGPQTLGTTYTVTVANTVTDLQDAAVGTPNTATFPAFVTPAVVRINEVNANVTMPAICDMIELRVISGGSMGGFVLKERDATLLTFPATFVVAKNDYIVIHHAAGNALCNANTATQELVSKSEQAAAAFAGNFDSAYDFWIADAGITNTDNVITLFDAINAVHEAVFVSNSDMGMAAAASKAAGAIVGSANQWLPALTVYTDSDFRTNAVLDLDATGNTTAGTSLQRLNDMDTNAEADWTTGAGDPATWGANNAGQTDIP